MLQINTILPSGIDETWVKYTEAGRSKVAAFRALFSIENHPDFSETVLDGFNLRLAGPVCSNDRKYELRLHDFHLYAKTEKGPSNVWIIIGTLIEKIGRIEAEVLGISKPKFDGSGGMFEWLQDKSNWHYLKE